MQVVGQGVLEKFKQEHTDAKQQADAWYQEAMNAKWASPADIKARYGSASILAGNQVVFNIKGNKYRILVMVDYRNQIVRIKEADTHQKYMRW